MEQVNTIGSVITSLCAVAAVGISLLSIWISRRTRKEDKRDHREERSGEKRDEEYQRLRQDIDSLFDEQSTIKENYLERFGKVQDTIHETRLDLTEQIYNLKTETLLGIQRIQEMIIGKL